MSQTTQRKSTLMNMREKTHVKPLSAGLLLFSAFLAYVGITAPPNHLHPLAWTLAGASAYLLCLFAARSLQGPLTPFMTFLWRKAVTLGGKAVTLAKCSHQILTRLSGFVALFSYAIVLGVGFFPTLDGTQSYVTWMAVGGTLLWQGVLILEGIDAYLRGRPSFVFDQVFAHTPPDHEPPTPSH